MKMTKISMFGLLGLLLVLTTSLSWAQVSRPSGNNGTGFFVKNGNIYDANGNEFIPYGANSSVYWGGNGDCKRDNLRTSIPNAGANSVRIVTQTSNVTWPWNSNPTVQRELVQLAVDSDIVPMLEMHDATGNGNIQPVIDYWVSPAMVQLCQDFEREMIINIANEWNASSNANWRDTYINAVQRMRNAGIKNMIVIDGGANYGQSPAAIKQYGSAVVNADPQKNVCFSIHMYAYWKTDGTAASWQFNVQPELQAIKNQGLALMIGEFGWDQPSGSEVRYNPRTLIDFCETLDIGWYFWAFFDGDTKPYYNVVNNLCTGYTGNSNQLTSAGQYLVNYWQQNAQTATIFNGGGNPPANTLTLNTNSLSYGNGASSQNVTVSSNVSWTVTDDKSWISVNPTSGSNNGSFSISVTANTNTTQRAGIVAVSGGGITRTVTVTQAAGSGGGGSASYRYLRLTALEGVTTTYDPNVAEINYFAGSTTYPTSNLGSSSSQVSATVSSGNAYQAFDGNNTSIWGQLNSLPARITLDVGQTISPDRIEIVPAYEGRALKAFRVEGSSDNSNWTVLLETSGLVEGDWTRGVAKSFTLSGSGGGSQNQAPSVSLSSPSNGATFTQGANITVSATASDSDGSISQVQFFNGSTSLGTDTGSPYSITISNASAGTYTLTAVATDNDGATTTSSTRTITVNAPSGGGGTTRLEGEGGSWTNGVVTNTSTASGGQFIDLNAGSNLSWTFNASSSGSYTLEFAVIAPSGTRSMGAFVNGTKVGVLTTNSPRYQWDIKTLTATLNSGNNTIELRDTEGTNEFDVDYVDVTGGSSGGGGGGSSTIVVHAAGKANTETMVLTINGTDVQTWNNVGGNATTPSYATYTYTHSSTVSASDVRVRFTNDGTGRDLRVDKIVVDGVTHEAEGQAVNTGAWGNNACGGISFIEWLHCAGYIEFGTTSGSQSSQQGPVSFTPAPVAEETTSSEFEVYPNPGSGEIHFHLPEDKTGTGQISIYDQRGQLVKELKWKQRAASDEIKTLIPDLDPGLYLIEYIQNGERTQKRFLKR